MKITIIPWEQNCLFKCTYKKTALLVFIGFIKNQLNIMKKP